MMATPSRIPPLPPIPIAEYPAVCNFSTKGELSKNIFTGFFCCKTLADNASTRWILLFLYLVLYFGFTILFYQLGTSLFEGLFGNFFVILFCIILFCTISYLQTFAVNDFHLKHSKLMWPLNPLSAQLCSSVVKNSIHSIQRFHMITKAPQFTFGPLKAFSVTRLFPSHFSSEDRCCVKEKKGGWQTRIKSESTSYPLHKECHDPIH